MPHVVYYVAASLDGYIADAQGGIDWLSDATDPDEGDYGYAAFYATVDALVMGRTTYDQVRGFGAWPYAGRPAFVFTHTPPEHATHDHPEVTFVGGDPAEVLARFDDAATVWLVGGGRLAASFQAAGLLDELYLTVLPILLGDGVPLLPVGGPQTLLTLTDATPYASGVVQLRYRPRSS